MGFFNTLFGNRFTNFQQNTAINFIGGSQDTGQLTWQEAKRLYTESSTPAPAIINNLVHIALNRKRKITSSDNCPPEIINTLYNSSKRLDLDQKVMNAVITARVYGLSGLFLVGDYDNEADKLERIGFNIIDPLFGKTEVQLNNPNKVDFQEIVSFRVNGKKVPDKFVQFIANEDALYLEFNSASFNYTGRSALANCYQFLLSYEQLPRLYNRYLSKMGSIVYTANRKNMEIAPDIEELTKSRDKINQLTNDDAVVIRAGEAIDNISFDMGGLDSVYDKLIDSIAVSAEVPKSLLYYENVSKALSEGKFDAEIQVQKLKHIQSMAIKLYEFADRFIAMRDITIDDIIALKPLYPSLFQGLVDPKAIESRAKTLKAIWIDSLSTEYEEVIKINEEEEARSKSIEIDNLAKIYQLTGDKAFVESQLNLLYDSDEPVTFEEDSILEQLDNDDNGLEDNDIPTS